MLYHVSIFQYARVELGVCLCVYGKEGRKMKRKEGRNMKKGREEGKMEEGRKEGGKKGGRRKVEEERWRKDGEGRQSDVGGLVRNPRETRRLR
jgi:hypothetical protein